MSRTIQHRRGTTAEHENFIGAPGEITYDTDLKTLRVHDGETPGGHVIGGGTTLPENMDYVIETQLPTSENNYTWYRKYASGWVEQGGHTTAQTITLPVLMQDESYYIALCGECQQTNNNINIFAFRNKTKANFVVQGNVLNNNGQSSSVNSGTKYWQVSGMAG